MIFLWIFWIIFPSSIVTESGVAPTLAARSQKTISWQLTRQLLMKFPARPGVQTLPAARCTPGSLQGSVGCLQAVTCQSLRVTAWLGLRNVQQHQQVTLRLLLWYPHVNYLFRRRTVTGSVVNLFFFLLASLNVTLVMLQQWWLRSYAARGLGLGQWRTWGVPQP